MLTNGQGNGFLLPDTGVGNGLADAHPDERHDHNRQDNAESDGVDAKFFCFLPFGKLLFGELCGIFFRAKLFLAGCTHGIISSQLFLDCFDIFPMIRKQYTDQSIITYFYGVFKGERKIPMQKIKIHKKTWGPKPPCRTRFSRNASNHDLHEKAGGMPLPTFAAPNVHPTSKRGREVCNPAGKSNFPIQKCGSKRTRHAPSRKKTTPGNRLPRKGNP